LPDETLGAALSSIPRRPKTSTPRAGEPEAFHDEDLDERVARYWPAVERKMNG
jgi:hypothetical protein